MILTMHDISLTPQKSEADKAVPPGTLVLEGTVKTYRYVDEDEAAASAPPAAPTPGKGGRS